MIKKNTMISGYLHIDPKDIEKTKKEARKIYGDFENSKTYSIEITSCPHCGYNEKDVMKGLIEQAKKNQERLEKYGLDEFFEYVEFDNVFQALEYCYRNPKKEIEVEYKGKILLFRFNGKKLEEKYIKDIGISGIIVSSWSIVEAIYIEDIEKSWKNIKQYKGDKYER